MRFHGTFRSEDGQKGSGRGAEGRSLRCLGETPLVCKYIYIDRASKNKVRSLELGSIDQDIVICQENNQVKDRVRRWHVELRNWIQGTAKWGKIDVVIAVDDN